MKKVATLKVQILRIINVKKKDKNENKLIKIIL